MSKAYLQDMKRSEIPGFFHVARWHANGKVWISELTYSNKDKAQQAVDDLDSTRQTRQGALQDHPYFVWHKSMSEEEINSFKPDSEPL